MSLQDYCMNKDDLEFVLSVTHFKGTYPWNEDVYKSVPTAVKSAFTRCLPPQLPTPTSMPKLRFSLSQSTHACPSAHWLSVFRGSVNVLRAGACLAEVLARPRLLV